MIALKIRAWRTLAKLDAALHVSSLFSDTRDAVLMYHAVGEPEAYGNVSVERFRADLRYLTDRYEVVDLDTLVETTADEKRVAITFDDAFENVHEHALPVLREFSVPATVYAVADFVGTNQGYNDCSIMSADQLHELVGEPLVTVGNHTHTHPHLAEVDDETELREEIRGAQESLENLLGVSVDRFSYPYGSYDERTPRVVAETHDTAVTTVPRLCEDSVNEYLVPRITAHNPVSHVRWELTDLGDRVRGLIT
ncbi:polysaccharide deacetylase family protein [Haloarchaeobius litoreus]|uniref:Polysaccharide deacetylase family protein n=1 Tax=Haloarchaeobius litoreus TaxID=755306 RepID=A0ABD6DIE7_9EURY|nr:polysaccharide deacetylase family protein [Haloarchaeobius litoreus]